MHQFEMVNLDDLVPQLYSYRKFIDVWSFNDAGKLLEGHKKYNPYEGYCSLRLFKCLLLQFMAGISDSKLERFIQENNAGKWFVGFSLTEKTPNHTVFTRARNL